MWNNSTHPNLDGYQAINALVASVIPDPGNVTVTVLGDSWGDGAVIDGIEATLESAWGHPITLVDAATSGQTFRQQLDRWDADVVPTNPTVVIHYSGFANDLAQGRSLDEMRSNVTEFLTKCWALGALPVLLGVAPFSDWPASSATDHTAIQTLIDSF